MAVRIKGSLNPHGAPILRKEILENSQAFTEFDFTIVDTDGFIAEAAANTALFGVLVGIMTYDGVGLTDNGAGGDYTGTYTTAATNETVAKVKGEIDISQFSLWSVDADAALETTAGSSQLSTYFDLIDEQNVDESTVADTILQLHSWGEDELINDNLVVNIMESCVFNVAA